MARKKTSARLFIVPGQYRVGCHHCGEVERIPLPMSFKAFGMMVKALVEKHRNCRAKGEERSAFK